MYARTGRGRGTTGLPVTDRQGRTIGRIQGRQYQKLVMRPDQILRSPPGFGFDAWAMEHLVLPRVDELVVECRFERRTYSVSVETFNRYRLAIDRGAGLQYVLPLIYWQADSDEPDLPSPVTPEPPAAPAGPVQGRLF